MFGEGSVFQDLAKVAHGFKSPRPENAHSSSTKDARPLETIAFKSYKDEEIVSGVKKTPGSVFTEVRGSVSDQALGPRDSSKIWAEKREAT